MYFLGRKGIEPSIAMLLSLQLNPSYQQTGPSLSIFIDNHPFSLYKLNYITNSYILTQFIYKIKQQQMLNRLTLILNNVNHLK